MHHLLRLSFLCLLLSGCSLESTTVTDRRVAADEAGTEPSRQPGARNDAPASSNDDATDPGDSGAGADAGSGGPFCEDLDTSSVAYVPVTIAPDAPPKLSGGTIASGTYVLTAALSRALIGSSPLPLPQLRGMLKTTGTELTVAVEPSGSVPSDTVHTATAEYSAAGGALTLYPVCYVYVNGTYEVPGAAEPTVVEYEATPTAITLRVLESITYEITNGNTTVVAKSVRDLVFTR